MEKFGGARGATNDVTILRMRVACWVSKATRAHREIYNNCFCTATMLSRTYLIVTLYVHCLSYLLLPLRDIFGNSLRESYDARKCIFRTKCDFFFKCSTYVVLLCWNGLNSAWRNNGCAHARGSACFNLSEADLMVKHCVGSDKDQACASGYIYMQSSGFFFLVLCE